MPYSAGYAIADITSLKALTPSDLVNGYLRFVLSKDFWYRYNDAATDSEDGDLIVAPLANPSAGRWFKSSQTVLPPVALPSRDTAQVTTLELANNQTANINAPLGKGFELYNITTNFPAWVRVYYTSADRTLDAGRPITTNVEDFNPNIKIITEVITSSSLLSIYLNPIRRGASYEVNPTSFARIAITNLSGASRAINTSFTKVTIEN